MPAARPTLLFAHVAYRFGEAYAARGGALPWIEVADAAGLAARLPEAEVLLVSGLWRNELAAAAPRLRLIQSMSAGVEQYDAAMLRARGIRLASAAGANAGAVAEHALALMLALARRVPEAVGNQARRHWRGMARDKAAREEQLAGRRLLVVGMGRIGARVAALGTAFGMRVTGLRRDPAAGGAPPGVALRPMAALHAALAEADWVVLTCALTPETRGLMDGAAFAALPAGAALVNVARGAVCDEAALVAALSSGRLRLAGLDVTAEEPLPAASPLWGLPNVLVTPHTAGETQGYEDAVLDILEENLGRLARGEALRNEVA